MKKYIIVDVDGTVSKVGDRKIHLEGENPDWDAFYDGCFEDEPIPDVIELVKNLSPYYVVAFCTGRKECVRDKTEAWILEHMNLFVTADQLLMRPNDDISHDTEMKPKLLESAGIEINDIFFILEDRNSMVKQ